MTTHFRSAMQGTVDTLPADLRSEAGSGLAGALHAARSLPADAAAALADQAREVFTDALGVAAILSAAVVVVTAVVATVGLRRLSAVPAAQQTRPVAAAAEADALMP